LKHSQLIIEEKGKDMQTVKHIKIEAKDGAEIPVLLCNLDDSSKKGVVIVCHGFGEHSGAYIDHAGRLWQGGYACVIPDQRGHGKPPEGMKKWYGCIPDYQYFIDDVLSVTDEVMKMAPDVPIAIYGHSMGGNIVINTLLSLPAEQASIFFCAMLESPWLELYEPISPIKRCLISFFSRVAPNLRNHRKLKYDNLSSDTERKQGYSKDPYYHNYISMRMIKGIMDGCSNAMENAAKLPVKTYLAYADNELVVSNKAIHEFAKRAGDMVTIKEYVSNHAIYNDVNRESYCRDLITFLDSQIGTRL